MSNEINLNEWYETTKMDYTTLPNGQMVIRREQRPVEQEAGATIEIEKHEISVADGGCETREEIKKLSLEEKDKIRAMRTFVLLKDLRELCVELAALPQSYSDDSLERQKIVDKIKTKHKDIGNLIGEM